jgi:hypothetical protein
MGTPIKNKEPCYTTSTPSLILVTDNFPTTHQQRKRVGVRQSPDRAPLLHHQPPPPAVLGKEHFVSSFLSLVFQATTWQAFSGVSPCSSYTLNNNQQTCTTPTSYSSTTIYTIISFSSAHTRTSFLYHPTHHHDAAVELLFGSSTTLSRVLS